MKLSEYSRRMGVHYRTAWRHWHLGKIKGFQDEDTGTIYVLDNNGVEENTAVLYSRVSPSENKSNAESQLERLRLYAMAKGYRIIDEKIEVSSGLNDKRPKLEGLLKQDNYKILLVEHKDRLTRFGFNYIEVLLNRQGQRIEVINEVKEEKEDLINDLVSIITSFCARIYGQRRTKRKTEKIIQELESEKLKDGITSIKNTDK
jgi:resolvase domain protein